MAGISENIEGSPGYQNFTGLVRDLGHSNGYSLRYGAGDCCGQVLRDRRRGLRDRGSVCEIGHRLAVEAGQRISSRYCLR